jgi:hypothetical protein
MKRKNVHARFVLCINNQGYKASLVTRRIYRSLPDTDARKRGLLRVIDESGEDYLYPADYFAPIVLPHRIAEAFALACLAGLLRRRSLRATLPAQRAGGGLPDSRKGAG